jgi:hypothetical protein
VWVVVPLPGGLPVQLPNPSDYTSGTPMYSDILESESLTATLFPKTFPSQHLLHLQFHLSLPPLRQAETGEIEETDDVNNKWPEVWE